jgi:predicted transcriptional regulator
LRLKQLEPDDLQPERVHLGAFVDRQFAERLTALAREQDRSVSSVIRCAIVAHLERERSGQA